MNQPVEGEWVDSLVVSLVGVSDYRLQRSQYVEEVLCFDYMGNS